MEKEINIKKGDKFLCIKDVYLNDNETRPPRFIQGKIYTSERGGCITDETGNKEHYITLYSFYSKHFKPYIKEEPNVFVYIRGIKGRGAEVIELLEKLGGKNIHGLSGIDSCSLYFINSNGVISGCKAGYATWIVEHHTEVFLPELKPEYILKPFDRVLVRDEDDDGNFWKVELFSHYDASSEYPYYCLSSNYSKCIPYEGNEHLLGTDKEV